MMRLCREWGALLFLTLLFVLSVAGFEAHAQMKIYWGDNNTSKVQRANLDGSVREDIGTGYPYPDGIVIDSINGKIYWGNGTSPSKIVRANLDGSGAVDFITGLSNVADMALDVPNGKIYWTSNITGKIQRANLADGSNIQDLVTGRADPTGISLDTANHKIVWAERTGPKICRSNLDGSSVQDLITSGLISPFGLEVDSESGKIYFSDFGTGKIQKSNLDGTAVTDVLTGLGWDVDAIALDTANRIIYYATFNTKICKVNFDGTGNADVITGLGTTTGVAILLPVHMISGNAGAAGATLSYTDGTPKTATASGSGNYSFAVSYNWSGTVTPSLTGYSFTPAYRVYTFVRSDQTGQDYAATPITFTISGNAGVAGATLSYTDGTPKTATASGSGNYSFAVSYNWSGAVTPSLTGYNFTPSYRTYTNVLSDKTNQNYTAVVACSRPTLATHISSITRSGSLNTLIWQDPNGSSQRTGWNIRRSANPALDKSTWPLEGANVPDAIPGTLTDIEWTDTDGNPVSGATWYYQVTAYNSGCPPDLAEGPF